MFRGDVVVGVGDCAYTNDVTKHLVTFFLATCVGVTLYCLDLKLQG